MKRKIFLPLGLLLLVLTGLNLSAQEGKSPTWSRRYGGGKDDGAYSIINTKDGGFALAGYTESFGEGNKDGWVLKLSAAGDLLWQYTFGIPKSTTNAEVCKHIIETSDGGFMVAGFVEDLTTRNRDAWLIRLDRDGKFLWEKRYGGEGEDAAASVIETREGDFIFAGYTKSFGTGDSDYWMLRVDLRGNIVWGRRYGSKADDQAVGIVQGNNGQFIVAGFTESGGRGGKDVWLLALDADGKILWEKTYDRDFNDLPKDIILNQAGSYTVTGVSGLVTKSGKLATFGWIMKIDPSGAVLSDKVYGIGLQTFSAAAEAKNRDLVLSGSTEDDKGNIDYWISRVDATGNQLWNRAYGGLAADTAESIVVLPGGGLAAVGITESFPGLKNIWVIRMDSEGLVQE